jgi:diphosphomevalonate decarboxylase
LINLVSILNQPQTLQTWREAFEICWAEFWDMHALFETSKPSFGYMTANTMAVLEKVKEFWSAHQDGPLTTMDAGANVHLLWRDDQWTQAQSLLKVLEKTFKVVSSRNA